MNARSRLALALLASVALDANASVITVQVATTSPAAQANAAAYKLAVDAAIADPAAYKGSKSVAVYDNLSVKNYFGGISNYAFESTIDFGVTAAQAGMWNFRTGVDFGYGGALFVDGVALGYNTHDMWWANSYGAGNGSLQGALDLAAGNHVLKIYGIEGCCDGGMQAYATFASTDQLNAVPEPVGIATFGLGAGAIAFIRRRRKQA